MRKKILSALLLGLFTVASTSTFVSCKDYDDDISNLQEQITKNNTDLTKLVNDKYDIVNAEIQKVNDALDAAEKACAEADKKLQANIDAANKAITDGDAATLAAAKKAVEDAMVQVAATYATKAELQKAQTDLETAYKAADELIKKDVAANAEQIANLLEADKKLDAAVKAAQKTADDALTLAQNIEKTYATKAELADEIKKVNESLAGVKEQLEGKIGDNLQKISVLETRVDDIEPKVTANVEAISTLRELTRKHGETLTALNSHMDRVCDSLKTLDAAIAANADSIVSVKNALTAAYTQAINAATAELKDSVSATNVRIADLKAAVNDSLDNVKGTIAAAENSISIIEDSIDKVIDRVEAIESRLAIINADLSNLITSIIYNGQTKNAVVFGTMTENAINGNKRFPYDTYEGEDSIVLKKDSSLMTVNNGLVYATINPAEIDFAGTSVKIVNSQNAEHSLFSLGGAEVVTSSDPVLTITRAAEGFGNGLYKFEIKAKKSGIKTSEFVGANSVYATTDAQSPCIAYALQASYKYGDTARTVTSHYDLAIVPKAATEVNAADLTAVEPGADVDVTSGAPYTMKFDLAADAAIEGSFKFKDLTSANVYAVYVGLDTLGNPAAYKKFKGVELSENGILTGKDIEKAIKMTVPASLLNVPVPVKGYVLNYNGKIVPVRESIVFTRSIFGRINVELTDTLKHGGRTELDITKLVISKIVEAKGGDKNAAKLFASLASLPVDSVEDYVSRVTVSADGDTIKNTFVYVVSNDPGRGIKFVDGKSVVEWTVNFKDANKLPVATINYKVNVVIPTWYDELNMRIKSAFGVIDGDKDYTVGWTTKDNTNPEKTKVAYEWNHRSFNISRFITAKNDRGDSESTLSYKTSATYAPYNQFVDEDADARDSVSVTHIKIFQGNGITAINTNAGADTVNTKFDVQQVVNYFDVAEKVIDNFKFSIASPINYGIFMGGVKTVNATVASTGKGTADLKSFQWNDYSNNLATFKLDDNRIASVECVLVQDTDNYYDRIENHTIEVKRASNKLEFNVVPGVITKAYPIYADVIIKDYWGIQTSLRICINVSAYNVQVSTNP